MRVTVVDYRPAWERMYQEEAERIRRILGGELLAIHHIGSTSVRGLKAKPIIDILPVVRAIDRVDAYNQSFEQLGYACMGEYGIPGRRFFRKGEDVRTHHIHIFQADNQRDITRHLAVRDYLRAHEQAARAYEALKCRLAERYPDDIAGYCDGKDAFVKRLEREALVWYAAREKD